MALDVSDADINEWCEETKKILVGADDEFGFNFSEPAPQSTLSKSSSSTISTETTMSAVSFTVDRILKESNKLLPPSDYFNVQLAPSINTLWINQNQPDSLNDNSVAQVHTHSLTPSKVEEKTDSSKRRKLEKVPEKTKKELQAERNCRSKGIKGLFKKTNDFIEKTELSAITIIKDYKGNFLMLGSEDFKKIVMSRKPLIPSKTNVYQYSDLDKLSFQPNFLPAVETASPNKTPTQIAMSLPGASGLQKELLCEYKLKQGASNIFKDLPVKMQTKAKIEKKSDKKEKHVTLATSKKVPTKSDRKMKINRKVKEPQAITKRKTKTKAQVSEPTSGVPPMVSSNICRVKGRGKLWNPNKIPIGRWIQCCECKLCVCVNHVLIRLKFPQNI